MLDLLPPQVAQRVVDLLTQKNAFQARHLAQLWRCELGRLRLTGGSVDWCPLVAAFALEELEFEGCRAATDNGFVRMATSRPPDSPSSGPRVRRSPELGPAASSVKAMPLLTLGAAAMSPDKKHNGDQWSEATGRTETLAPPTLLAQTLRVLRVHNCPLLTHRGLYWVGNLAQLETLELPECGVSNRVLTAIALLPSLRRLELRACAKITSAGLAELVPLATTLEELDLSDCERVTGSGFVHLAQLILLRDLRLRNVRMNDAHVEKLRPLVRMEHLELYGASQVTDEGLLYLVRMVRLRHLCLTQTQVSHVFLRRLSRTAPNLCELHITQSRQTTADGLRAVLPQFGGSLRELKLRGVSAVTSESLIAVRELPALEVLNITDCKQIELSAEHVFALNGAAMRKLQARSVAWSEDGFAALGRLRLLEHLDISRAVGVFDADFEVMGDLRELRHLDLSFNELHDDALRGC